MSKALILALLLLPITLFADDDLKSIEWMTEVFPPYNFYDADNTLQGISVEITEALFNTLGIQKNRRDIIVYPWARGYQMVQKPGLKNILFSMSRTKEREDKVKWFGPIGKITVSVFGKSDSPLIERHNLKNFRFSSVRSDVSHQMLLKHGVPKDNLMLASSISQIIDLLMTPNRVDFAACERGGFLHTIVADGKYEVSQFKEVATLEVGEAWFAVNKSIDENVVKKLQRALDKVKKDPALKTTLKKKFMFDMN